MKKIYMMGISLIMASSSAFSQYCIGGPFYTGDSNIESVSLVGDAANTLTYTGCPGVAGLENQTALSTDLTAGTTYSLDVQFGTCGGNYNNAGEVWIDFNGNYVFDSSESIGDYVGSIPTALSTFTFTVPTGAVEGPVNMRVMQREGGSLPLDPCSSFSYGSVTDFTINLFGGTGCYSPTNLNASILTATTADLTWNAAIGGTTYAVEWGLPNFVPGTGTEVGAQAAVAGLTTNVTGLTPEANYEFFVMSDCAGSTTWAGPFAFLMPPTCPTPSALVTSNGTLTSVELSWDENGGATEWLVEYGSNGFVLGTGTTVTANTNMNFEVNSLLINEIYDFYVRSYCSVGDTSSYSALVTYETYDLASNTLLEWNTDCPVGGFVDISSTGTATGLGDDDEVGVTMDFNFVYQGIVINEVTIGDNGGIELGTLNGQVYQTDLANANNHLYPFGDDLENGDGDVYYETVGTAPNRQFIVQWNDRLHYDATVGENVTFELIIMEGSNEIYFVYDDVEFGGSEAINDFGATADIGVSGPVDFHLSDNDAAFLMANTCVHFYYPSCPKPSNLTSNYVTTDSIGLAWDNGNVETEWMIQYGTGLNQSSTQNPDTLGMLDQFTTYEIYVQAVCGVGDSSDVVGPISVQTLPTCPAPTNLIFAYAANDTVSLQWTPEGLATAWVMEYGISGYLPGSGTQVSTVLDPDTIFNLLPGTVYDFYVQSDCGNASNNPWVGPITYATPIVNDSTCDAVMVPVDGSTTVYSNAGATTQLLTPVTGFNSVWFTFVAPASGHVEVSTCGNTFDNLLEVYEATDCSDFTTFTLVDGATDNPFATCAGTNDPAGINLCGLTAGNTYYLMIGSEVNGVTGTFPLTLTELQAIEAGTSIATDVCEDNAAFDLFTAITGNLTTNGVWYNPTAAVGNDLPSTISLVGAPAGTYSFDYVQTETCGADTVTTLITVVGLPNLGVGSVLASTCNFGSVGLFDGLSGNVDLGGTWTNGTDAVGSVITYNGEAAGTYDYYYVVDNGVCSADSTTVTVTLQDCLGLDANEVSALSVYPNPVADVLTIANLNVEGIATITLLNVQGKVVYTSTVSNVNGNYELDLSNFENGIYVVEVTSELETQKVRVVKH